MSGCADDDDAAEKHRLDEESDDDELTCNCNDASVENATDGDDALSNADTARLCLPMRAARVVWMRVVMISKPSSLEMRLLSSCCH